MEEGTGDGDGYDCDWVDGNGAGRGRGREERSMFDLYPGPPRRRLPVKVPEAAPAPAPPPRPEGQHQNQDQGQEIKKVAPKPKPKATQPPLRGNERHYMKIISLKPDPSSLLVKLSSIRVGLRAALEGAVKYLRTHERATSQVLSYPMMTELECAKLILFATRDFRLHAMGVQSKDGRKERCVVLYKKNPGEEEEGNPYGDYDGGGDAPKKKQNVEADGDGTVSVKGKGKKLKTRKERDAAAARRPGTMRMDKATMTDPINTAAECLCLLNACTSN